MNTESSKQIVDSCLLLYGHALKLTRDPDQASDLVQDTTLKALLYFKNFKPGTNLSAWLYVIMRNIFINEYRRKLREQELTYQLLSPAVNLDQDSARSDAISGKFLRKDIERAISLLPEIQGKIFIKYYEGFRYSEIAAEFGVPIGTVKTRIFKAKEHMRKHLGAYN